jgi:transcriptional regulator with XRE-family HTH domain
MGVPSKHLKEDKMKNANYLYLFNYLKYKLNLKNDKQLAKKIGISQSFLSEIKNGKKGLGVGKILLMARKVKIKEEILFYKLCKKTIIKGK